MQFNSVSSLPLNSLSISTYFQNIGPTPPHFVSLWPRHSACRILVPQPGIKLGLLAVRTPNPIHWTVMQFPTGPFKKKKKTWNNTMVGHRLLWQKFNSSNYFCTSNICLVLRRTQRSIKCNFYLKEDNNL